MPLSDNVVRDGDAGFIGFASRLNPLTLPAGMLQDSVNMRLDRGVAQTRKGSKRLTDNVGTTSSPLTLNFILNDASPPVVRDSYDGGLYAAGVYASQNYQNANEYIVLAGNESAVLWRDGVSPVTKSYPTSPAETLEATDTASVVQAFDRLYILREADRTATGFTDKVLNAVTTVSGTVATVTSNSHGFTAGMRVRLEGGDLAVFDWHEYDVKATNLTPNTFEIDVPSGTANDTATTGRTVRRVKPPLYWDGNTSATFVRAAAGVPAEGVSYTRMPSTGWATYFNNRLWLARNRDTVAISDFLDSDLYDPAYNTFRAGAGGNDRIVAVHPWVEGQALVFCRKSIWLATLNQFQNTGGDSFEVDLPLTNMQMLTDEIGCSSRNSIVTAGNFVFFLSDAGIYRLDSRLDLKLRGDTRPLSEPIADLFATVNQTRVEKSAFGVWLDNRYLVALPTSSDPLDGNQLVICWNSLNEQWEYRDTYPSSASVNEILVATYQNKRRVFSIPRAGNLYVLEENTDGTDDNAFGSGTSAITGSIKTRRYNFNELSSKRFLRSVANAVIPNGASVTTKVNIIDPDKVSEQIGSITNSSGVDEDYHLKSPVRFKAHAAELIYETTGGRPEIRSVALEASPKSLPATLTRNEQ